MDREKTAAEVEFAATSNVYNALAELDPDARERVVAHVVAMLGITDFGAKRRFRGDSAVEDEGVAGQGDTKSAPAPTYATFAELFDAGHPLTTARKALLAGYWLQVCQGAESFDGQSANRELNHLGHRVPNITNAIASLNAEKPALAIQIKKSGSSQQARKTYKITTAGIEAVKAMLNE